jgi:hypothetical protein
MRAVAAIVRLGWAGVNGARSPRRGRPRRWLPGTPGGAGCGRGGFAYCLGLKRFRNLLGHSSAAFRNALTRPHRLQRPLLVAPAGISITQWWVHPCCLRRPTSGTDLLGISSPRLSSCSSGHHSTGVLSDENLEHLAVFLSLAGTLPPLLSTVTGRYGV